MITFKANTLDGNEVEGWYVQFDHATEGLIYSKNSFDPELVDPTTLRLLINGKEYTMEEVEKGMHLFEWKKNVIKEEIIEKEW